MSIALYICGVICFLFSFIGIVAAKSVFHEMFAGIFMIAGLIAFIGGAIIGQGSQTPRTRHRGRFDNYDDEPETYRKPYRRKRKTLPSGLSYESSDEEEAQTDSGRLPKIKRHRISQRRR